MCFSSLTAKFSLFSVVGEYAGVCVYSDDADIFSPVLLDMLIFFLVFSNDAENCSPFSPTTLKLFREFSEYEYTVSYLFSDNV